MVHSSHAHSFRTHSFINKGILIFSKPLLLLMTVSLIASLSSCISLRHRKPISRTLYDTGIKNEKQLTKFFMDSNPDADKAQIHRLAKYYIQEGAAEGINSDCAFVQMCLETGFLKFGNLVTPEMHNYCGLGSMDADHPGEVFATEQLGVRAHTQHLHAYATTEDITLNNECIDRRYKYVKPRGKAPTIYQLAGTWAMDKNYATKLDALLTRLEQY